jgi:UDPglucose 6-dehydrogenase
MRITVIGSGYVGLVTGACIADMRFVLAAATEVAEAVKHPLVLVTKSTVPVGTSERIERVVQKNGAKRSG